MIQLDYEKEGARVIVLERKESSEDAVVFTVLSEEYGLFFVLSRGHRKESGKMKGQITVGDLVQLETIFSKKDSYAIATGVNLIYGPSKKKREVSGLCRELDLYARSFLQHQIVQKRLFYLIESVWITLDSVLDQGFYNEVKILLQILFLEDQGYWPTDKFSPLFQKGLVRDKLLYIRKNFDDILTLQNRVLRDTPL